MPLQKFQTKNCSGEEEIAPKKQGPKPHMFTGMELALKEQDPNRGGVLVRQILIKVRGFPSKHEIQKYQIKESEKAPQR